MPKPSYYPPLTAAGIATVVQLLLGEFFTTWTVGQVTAVGSAVFLVAAGVSQSFTRSKKSLAEQAH